MPGFPLFHVFQGVENAVGANQQHFAGAVLRTVENSRYLLRAAITGISGIVDSRGRILAESEADVKTTLTGVARLDVSVTVWTRWGYWIPRVADALGLDPQELVIILNWFSPRGMPSLEPAPTLRS